MIIHSLSNYYRRLKEAGDDRAPDYGFTRMEVSFGIEVTAKGDDIIIPLGEAATTKKRKNASLDIIVPREMIDLKDVSNPTAEIKRTSKALRPHFLWDKTAYILGVKDKRDEKPERTAEKHDALKNLHHLIGDQSDGGCMRAVLKFLDTWDPSQLSDEVQKQIGGFFCTFMYDGSFVCAKPGVQELWRSFLEQLDRKLPVGTCMVTGMRGPIMRLHDTIKNVDGGGASLSSFDKSAFRSFGLEQNMNAPVMKGVEFGYTAALNHLLHRESAQKLAFEDTTVVFWSDCPCDAEKYIPLYLARGCSDSFEADRMHGAELDDKLDEFTEDLDSYLDAIRKGQRPSELPSEAHYFVLGLSRNKSRLRVRFWFRLSLEELENRIHEHLTDISIDKEKPWDQANPSIFRLLRETKPKPKKTKKGAKNKTKRKKKDKADTHLSLLAGALLRAILTGVPYPDSLFRLVVTRTRADSQANYYRAALIKACLLRKASTKEERKEITVSLNEESTNVAYRLGRFFAVVERIQWEANRDRKINAPVGERFFGSMLTMPVMVFPQLRRLANHHLNKLSKDRSGLANNRNQLLDKILQAVDDIPPHLRLDEQGKLILGYHHQRAELRRTKNQTQEGKE